MCLCSGFHGAGRLHQRDERTEDRGYSEESNEAPGADHRIDRLKRSTHPGGNSKPFRTWTHFFQQRSGLGKNPTDLRNHGQLRRWCVLFAGSHGFYHHG